MTEVALKEYLESRLESLYREIQNDRTADKLAQALAHSTLEARLQHMNEFREQINRERRDFVRVDTLRWVLGFMVSLIGVAFTVAMVWHR